MDAEELALTMASRTGKLSVASGDDVSLRAFKSKMKGYSIGLKVRGGTRGARSGVPDVLRGHWRVE